jgi:signal transduction histidine kinase
VRRRLVAAIAGVAAASVGLFALPLGLTLQRTYRDDESIRLQRDTVAATRQIDLGAGSDRIELPRSGDRLTVYDRSGTRVAGSGPLRAGDLVVQALRTGRLTDRVGGHMLLAAVPLLVKERVRGAVLAARSDGAATARTHRAWWRLLALAGGVVLLAVLAAIALGRRLTVPLERLAAAARRLGDGNFSARAPRSGIGELDAVGHALDATAARLHELVARERAFSADASHQLRTPLAALRLELEAMALGGIPAAELDRALTEVERLQTTIDTLLAVARDAPRDHGPAEVTALLRELEHDWRPVLAEQARPLRVTLPEPLLAQATPAVVREILGVLMANAHDHGAGAVTVTARRTPGEAFLAVEVADEGPGVEDPGKVFDRRASGSAEGHGIGLALARSLAHAEGGRLALAGAGPGPTFVLTLAASPGGGQGAPGAPAEHPVPAAAE